MPRPPVNKTRKLAAAQAEGEFRGKLKAMKRASIQQKVELLLSDMVKGTSIEQAVDVAINVGLAYAGYEIFKDWKGALVGPIALKLAQSENAVSGTAGLIGLASLGVASLLPSLTEALKPLFEGAESQGAPPTVVNDANTCPLFNGVEMRLWKHTRSGVERCFPYIGTSDITLVLAGWRLMPFPFSPLK